VSFVPAGAVTRTAPTFRSDSAPSRTATSPHFHDLSRYPVTVHVPAGAGMIVPVFSSSETNVSPFRTDIFSVTPAGGTTRIAPRRITFVSPFFTSTSFAHTHAFEL